MVWTIQCLIGGRGAVLGFRMLSLNWSIETTDLPSSAFNDRLLP